MTSGQARELKQFWLADRICPVGKVLIVTGLLFLSMFTYSDPKHCGERKRKNKIILDQREKEKEDWSSWSCRLVIV